MVYISVGAVVCLISLAQADVRHLSDFQYYLFCAIIAALGLRLTTHRTSIPASFLVMLLAIEDLSLPELLFIASVIALLSQFQDAGRTLPRISGLIFCRSSRVRIRG